MPDQTIALREAAGIIKFQRAQHELVGIMPRMLPFIAQHAQQEEQIDDDDDDVMPELEGE